MFCFVTWLQRNRFLYTKYSMAYCSIIRTSLSLWGDLSPFHCRIRNSELCCLYHTYICITFRCEISFCSYSLLLQLRFMEAEKHILKYIKFLLSTMKTIFHDWGSLSLINIGLHISDIGNVFVCFCWVTLRFQKAVSFEEALSCITTCSDKHSDCQVSYSLWENLTPTLCKIFFQ